MRACRRYISTSARLCGISSPFHSFKVSRFLELLSRHRETKHNVFPLLKAIQHVNFVEGPSATTHPTRWIEAVLRRNNSVSVGELEKWQPVLHSESIESAIEILRRLGYITQVESASTHEENVEPITSPPRQPIPIPPWILFYLVSHKVLTPSQASGPMVSLILSHLYHTPQQLRHSLIILSMFQLARFNAVLPMQLLTSQFLRLDRPKHLRNTARASEIYQNFLLQAIASNPVRSAQSATSTIALLKSMNSRKLQLWQNNCDELLKDRFVIAELTKWLRERAIRSGYVPKSDLLNEPIDSFNGPMNEGKEKYEKAVRKVQQRSEGEGLVTIGGSETDRFSPIHFLQVLVGIPSRLVEPLVSKASSLPEVTEPHPSLPVKTVIPPPAPTFFLAPHRRFDSVPKKLHAQWTAGFRRAVKDISRFSADELVRYFEWGIPSASWSSRIQDDGQNPRLGKKSLLHVRPNLGLYTILIRGLLVRGERSSCNPKTRINGCFRLAEKYFTHLRNSGFQLDSHAIAVGLEAYTRVGKPHIAFALLNDYCSVPSKSPTVVNKMERATKTEYKKLFRKIQLSSIAMNDFMVSLARIGRDDCVLWLFEHSVDLYSVYPDSRALSIFLQSARKIQKINRDGDGWDGLWSLFKRKKPLADVGEAEKGEGEEGDRDPLRRLHALVGRGGKPMPYQHANVGNDGTLLSQVQMVFRSCVIGQAWTYGMAAKEHDRTTPTGNPDFTLLEKPPKLHIKRTELDQRLGKEAVNRLLSVVSPAHPFIPNEDTSFFDSLAIPLPFSTTKRLPRLSLADLLRYRNLNVDTMPSYPQVVLQDSHFRDYILFLGLAPQAPPIFREGWKWIPPVYELSLVLAWQRYLRVPPSRDTLAAAIALFGEHGDTVPPLVDELRFGLGEGGEYVKFIRWIEDWIEEVEGDKGVGLGLVERQNGNGDEDDDEEVGGVQMRPLMPDVEMLTKWRRIILRMREGRQIMTSVN